MNFNFKKYFILITFTLLLPFNSSDAFEKVIIWGHKLHSHTHSYIHEAFYKAFLHLGYTTYWLDNQDVIDDLDLSNSLFITEGQVDSKIPLRNDSIYLLHNANVEKYLPFRYAYFQVYTDDVLKWSTNIKQSCCHYYNLSGKCMYFPWATDLLPHQIDAIKKSIPYTSKQYCVNWVGTISNGSFGNLSELQPFRLACKDNLIDFKSFNPWQKGISAEEHVRIISSSYMAPAIVGTWQKKNGYIPCRIFKNISYGQFGITNSERTYELFDKKIIFNEDTYTLFYDAKAVIEGSSTEDLFELMDFVKNNHTYINRIQFMLNFIKELGYIDEDDIRLPTYH